MPLRIATFNVENLDDEPGQDPTLADRIAIMRPQLERPRADVLCLQEVHSQGPGGNRTLDALIANRLCRVAPEPPIPDTATAKVALSIQ